MRWVVVLIALVGATTARADDLPGTRPLDTPGDLAARMVEGMEKYLMRETAASVERRQQRWKPDYSSRKAAEQSLEPNRQRLKKALGVVDPRVPVIEVEYVATTGQPSVVA